MRIASSIVGTLLWRLAVTRSGLVLRIQELLSIALVATGVGTAVGYAIVSRMGRRRG